MARGKASHIAVCVAMHTTLTLTVALMIAANASVKWIEIPEQELEDVIDYIDDDTWWFHYGVRNRRNTDQRTTSVGLWNTAIGRHGNIKNIHAYRAAEAFAILSFLTLVAGIGLTVLLELRPLGQVLSRVPCALFVATGALNAFSAFSFIAFANSNDVHEDGGGYGAAFVVAWFGVAAAFVTAGLALIHHNNKLMARSDQGYHLQANMDEEEPDPLQPRPTESVCNYSPSSGTVAVSSATDGGDRI